MQWSIPWNGWWLSERSFHWLYWQCSHRICSYNYRLNFKVLFWQELGKTLLFVIDNIFIDCIYGNKAIKNTIPSFNPQGRLSRQTFSQLLGINCWWPYTGQFWSWWTLTGKAGRSTLFGYLNYPYLYKLTNVFASSTLSSGKRIYWWESWYNSANLCQNGHKTYLRMVT